MSPGATQESAHEALRRPFSCPEVAWRAKSWAEVAKVGRVAHEPHRGWHIEFRSVRWPGHARPRRIRVTHAPLFGRLDTRELCEQCLTTIRQRLMGDVPLHQILTDYLDGVPEDEVLQRYAHEFLPEQRRKHARGSLSDKRLQELSRYPGRGVLDYWAGVGLNQLTSASLVRWKGWLEDRGHGPRYVRHILVDFGAFLRFEHSIGSLEKVPTVPRVEVPHKEKRVPRVDDLRRVLDAIPEPERGLWLARGLAGLRPSEARRLDVSDYLPETGELVIPGKKTKKKRGRVLPIRDVVPELHEWILRHRAGAFGAEPLFVNPRGRRGKRWLEHAEGNVWGAALEACGLEHVEPNEGGRHASATHFTEAGVDVRDLQEWLGHSSIASTRVYQHASSGALARRMLRSIGPGVDQGPDSKKKEEKIR